ncbi:LysR family transcriptional regulator [Gordonia liuliyuniae]|uniref:LysR family transcriptional regulator n=1 Tax=Gordonia liuliyuniae TaxID=2911517 RepID=A0ABS9IYA1_9ACTN|nr:LysR family transcriptional regulator [Gordonia liuliyuniae]MCF8590440.1 LysR family transcriptional regulator [Gordonia liuliyuniae]
MIDVSALQALRALADLGTMSRVADDLGFTASAISQKIKRLEAEVGVRLVSPAGRRVVLTAAGRALVESVPGVVQALEQSVSAARSADAGVPRGMFRIVAFSTAVRGIVAPVLAGLAVDYPDLRVEIVEGDPVPAVYAVESGGADLALVHDADGVPTPVSPGVRPSLLHTDVGDLAVPAGHPLTHFDEPIGMEDLAGCRWVTSPPGTVCHQWFQRMFAGSVAEPDVVHSVDDFSTQMALVASGDVVALIPRLARPTPPAGVELRPLKQAPRRVVHAVWRRSSEDDPALRAVVAALEAEAS